jgi:hypothetical protein
MDKRLDSRRGTLDLLMRNAASLGPLHGYDWNPMTDSVSGTLGTTSEEV